MVTALFFGAGVRVPRAAHYYSVSPIEPNDAGDGLNGGEDVARVLFVAGSDRSKLLDLDGEVVVRCRAP
jgi:hypothetical protein